MIVGLLEKQLFIIIIAIHEFISLEINSFMIQYEVSRANNAGGFQWWTGEIILSRKA